MRDIYEAMKEKGATEAQLNSKTMAMVQDIIATEEDVIPATAYTTKRKISQAITNLENRTKTIDKTLTSIENSMNSIRNMANNYIQEEKSKVIEDTVLKDSLLMYIHVLEETKRIFGEENLTENVMINAIQAGSYGLWRSIMGGKFSNDERRRM